LIISRAPVRITLGGGGTDLESYYSKYGGFMISAAIDKYVFLAAKRRFYDNIRLSYSETEIVAGLEAIKHNIYREALRLLGLNGGLELVSIADVPANCGLGTSSSFTVSLLNALHAYKKEYVGHRQLAEEACRVEIEMLGAPIGKQDQYIAAFGGITCLTFERDGTVLVEPLKVGAETLDHLLGNLLFFYTGIERSASDILAEQDNRSKVEDGEMLANLHRVKEIGLQARASLERGKVDDFGELLHAHWEIKKRRSGKMSDPFIDECYTTARAQGVVGGKLIGAGGGGFLMFYCPNGNKPGVFQAMTGLGLKPFSVGIDFEGAKILVNI
jgi:D-glycero-alpha-D-manno-heptose-7-phosphate kinase